MREIFKLVLVCTLAVGFAPAMNSNAANAEEATPREVNRTYRDQARGFSIALPRAQDWQFTVSSPEEVAVALENPYVTVEVVYQEVDQDLPADFLGVLGRDFAQERSEQYREIRARLANQGGTEFYELEYESRQEGKTLHTLRRTYVHQRRVITITVVGLENEWAKSRSNVTEILNSFSLLKIEAQNQG